MQSTARTTSTTTRGAASWSRRSPRKAQPSFSGWPMRRMRSWSSDTIPTSGRPFAIRPPTTAEKGERLMASSLYLIRNVTVIDGLGGDPLSVAGVLVEDDHIAWGGPAAPAPAPGAGVGGDGAARFLLPGVSNCRRALGNDGAARR